MNSVGLIKKILIKTPTIPKPSGDEDLDRVREIFFRLHSQDSSLRGQLTSLKEESQDPLEVSRTYCLEVLEKLNLLPIKDSDQGAAFIQSYLGEDVEEEIAMQARAQGFSPERFFVQTRELNPRIWAACVEAFYETFEELSEFFHPLIVVNPYSNSGPCNVFWKMVREKDPLERSALEEAYEAKIGEDHIDLLPFFDGVDLEEEASLSFSETSLGDPAAISVYEGVCSPGKIESFGFEDGRVVFESESGEKGSIFGPREEIENWLYYAGIYVARKAIRDSEQKKMTYAQPVIDEGPPRQERYDAAMRALIKKESDE